MTKLLLVAILALVTAAPSVAPMVDLGKAREAPGPWPGLSPPTGPSAHFEYRPIVPDAGAIFLRHDMAHARCVAYDLRYRLDPEDAGSLPRVLLAATQGFTARLGDALVDYEEEWSMALEDSIGASRHEMVNVTVGDRTLYRHLEVEQDPREPDPVLGLRVEWAVCQPHASYDRWVWVLTTARARNLTLTVDFYDNLTVDGDRVRGDAQGAITHLAESNRTFLAKLKDFQGTASYDGDPLGAGRPSAAGLNLELPIDTRRGFVGGMAEIGAEWDAGALTFRGPDGGVLVDQSDLRHVVASPGRSTFDVHAYASPLLPSGLYAWGADIDAGMAPLLPMELP